MFFTFCRFIENHSRQVLSYTVEERYRMPGHAGPVYTWRTLSWHSVHSVHGALWMHLVHVPKAFLAHTHNVVKISPVIITQCANCYTLEDKNNIKITLQYCITSQSNITLWVRSSIQLVIIILQSLYHGLMKCYIYGILGDITLSITHPSTVTTKCDNRRT